MHGMSNIKSMNSLQTHMFRVFMGQFLSDSEKQAMKSAREAVGSGNAAKAILNRSRDPGGERVKSLREIVNDSEIQGSARRVFGNLGISHDFEHKNDGDDIRYRAQLREIQAGLRNHITTKKEPTDDDYNAYDYLNALINMISNQMDMEADVESQLSRSGSGKSSVLRDESGRRVGTLLSNATLQSAGKIANQIGAGAEFGSDERVDVADFFRGVANMRTTEQVRNALSVGTDSAGGYTVPTVLLPGILNALVPASSLLSAGANIGLLQQDGAKSFRIAAIDTVPNPGWRNENGAVAESEPTFRAIDIVPRSLAFMFKVSRELLADSGGLEQALTMAIAAAFAKELDRAGLRGSGTAPEIKGLLNTANVNAIAFGGANGGKPANYSGFVDAWKAIATANAPAPKAAIMHPRDMATFANLADTTGQPLQRPPLLAPMEFFQTPQIPTNLTVGTSNDTSEIYVGDFSQFTFYIREGMSVQLASELFAGTGQVAFFCHTRVDAAVSYAQAFAVIKGVRP